MWCQMKRWNCQIIFLRVLYTSFSQFKKTFISLDNRNKHHRMIPLENKYWITVHSYKQQKSVSLPTVILSSVIQWKMSNPISYFKLPPNIVILISRDLPNYSICIFRTAETLRPSHEAAMNSTLKNKDDSKPIPHTLSSNTFQQNQSKQVS